MDRLSAGAGLDHRVDRRFEDAVHRPAPTGMRRGHNARSRSANSTGWAIGGQHG